MIKGEHITRSTLIQHLVKGFCKVQFRKQTNGQFRSLVCTLNTSEIPAKYAKSAMKTIEGGGDPNLLPVFDVVSRDWKSFYIPNVLYFYTEDELRGKKPEEPVQSEKTEMNNAKRTRQSGKDKAQAAKRKN
jgi:5-formyltetrahydrofolate cyclo-ligase